MSHRTAHHRVMSGVLDVSEAPHMVYDVSLDVRDAHVWDPESAAAPACDHCAELDDLVPAAGAGPDVSRAPKRHKNDSHMPAILSSGSSSAPDLHPPLPGLSTVKKQRPKQYKRREPSRFCHLCGRRSPNVPMAICSRVIDGMCRKVVCEFCFDKYGWDRSVIDDAKRVRAKNGSELDTVRVRKAIWECPHCEGKCGHKAQCKTYGRTNYKRHLRLRNKRNEQQESSSSRRHPGSSKKDQSTTKKPENGSKRQETTQRGSSRKQESSSKHSSK